MKFELELSEKENEALERLSQKQELNKQKVLIQALRLYQATVEGNLTIQENNPLRKML